MYDVKNCNQWDEVQEGKKKWNGREKHFIHKDLLEEFAIKNATWIRKLTRLTVAVRISCDIWHDG